ncbi:MAG: hypothetical protein L0287_03105 [Anaerolineae bacterium]|nr:hypothetical protein [Anaerolineae bacterium]
MGIDDYTTLTLHHHLISSYLNNMADVCNQHEALQPLETGFRNLGNQHKVNAELYLYIGQRLADEKEKIVRAKRAKNMVTMLMLVVMLTTGTIGWAQDSEPSPLTPLPQSEGELVTDVPTAVSPADDIVVVPGKNSVVVIRQDETFKPTHWILIGVIGLLALLLGTQGRTIIQPAILELSKNISPTALEIMLGAGRIGLDQAGKFVEITPTKIDDAAYLELKQGFADLEKQMREIKALAYRAVDKPPDGLT